MRRLWSDLILAASVCLLGGLLFAAFPAQGGEPTPPPCKMTASNFLASAQDEFTELSEDGVGRLLEAIEEEGWRTTPADQAWSGPTLQDGEVLVVFALRGCIVGWAMASQSDISEILGGGP